jgi:hypothetical protein
MTGRPYFMLWRPKDLLPERARPRLLRKTWIVCRGGACPRPDSLELEGARASCPQSSREGADWKSALAEGCFLAEITSGDCLLS